MPLLRVPAAYYSIEEDVNSKSTVSMQDVQFIRFLHRVQQHVGHGLRQIFDTALVLKNIDPDSVEYDITWPPLSTADEQAAADSFYREAQAWALLLGTNAQNQTPVIDREWVQQHGLELTEEEMNELNARLDAQAEEQRKAAIAAGAKVEEIGTFPSGGSAATNGVKPGGTNAPAVHDHTQRASRSRTGTEQGGNTARRPVRQEMRDAAKLLLQQARARLDPQLAAVEQGQAHALELSRELATLLPTRGEPNGDSSADD